MRKRVIVDSNLLLLFAIGLWNPRAIRTQKRLSGFTVDDFELLRGFLSQFESIATTAHILTEVSNLAGAASGRTRDSIFLQLSSLFVTMDEQVAPAVNVCSLPEFRRFGLTDAVLASLCSEAVLITEDGRLASHLHAKGLAVVSLTHLRALRESSSE